MTPRLFVYGTLAPGRPNGQVLADIPGEWAEATVKGRLLQEGWGAQAGYPGIVLDQEGAEIRGFVLTAEALPMHWARLDEFEGEGYRRVTTQATLENRERVDVFIYVLNRSQDT